MHYKEYLRFTEIGTLFIFVSYMIMPILSPYIKGLGFDEFQIGLIFSLYPLSIILFSPIMGKLSDSVGRKTVILSGILMQILALSLYVADGSALVLGFARMVNALGYVTVILTVLAKIEDMVDGKSRGRYVGMTMALENVSRMLGPVAGGLVADLFFVRAPFFLSIALLAVLSLYFLKDRPEKPRTLKIPDINPLRGIREFMSVGKLRAMGILGMVMHASMPATTVYLPIMLIERFGVSYTYVGIAMFVMGAVHVLEYHFGKLCDTMGRGRILFPGTLVFGISMLLIPAAWSYYAVLLFLFILSVGGSMWDIAAWSVLSDVGEEMKKEGQVVMTYASVAKTGSFASWIISGVVALYSIEMLFALNGLLIILGTILSFLIFRKG